ncbi:unnamed protein product [Caenorhabditis brenneri]
MKARSTVTRERVRANLAWESHWSPSRQLSKARLAARIQWLIRAPTLFQRLILSASRFYHFLRQIFVALGVFLSFLLLVFSIGTVIAWNRYNPIIQEFIIKENIEKARKKSSEKNSKC